MRTVPVVICVKDRPELTKQAITTCFEHTKMPIKVIAIDDGSTDPATIEILKQLQTKYDTGLRVEYMPASKYVGAAKNAGAAIAPASEFIYFSDNDVYFHKGWLEALYAAYLKDISIGILGGDKHPHHGVERESNGLLYSDTQVGYSMFMTRQAFNNIGPFLHFEAGTFGGEDSTLCERARDQGYKIASLANRVVTHCGLTTHVGTQCAGYPEYVAQDVPEGCIRI